MMAKIVLISCGKNKLDDRAPARSMYTGTLFKLSLKYAQSITDDRHIFVLSAKYGLLTLDEVICPYDKTLKKMKAQERKEWANKVRGQLEKKEEEKVFDTKNDTFIFLTGAAYNRDLLPCLEHTETPLKGKRIGEQMQWLTQ